MVDEIWEGRRRETAMQLMGSNCDASWPKIEKPTLEIWQLFQFI
jgi:hypothetical protein